MSIFDIFWTNKIAKAKIQLEKNGFDVRTCSTLQEAHDIILDIVEEANPSIAANGDSMSLKATGALDDIKKMENIIFIDGFIPEMPRPERMKMRHKALACDLFLTGVNAISEKGQLVWLDMIGNRIAPVAFGPSTVIIVAGRNKLSGTLEESMARVKKYAAPLNAIKHTGFKTPCQATSTCHDCSSPDRICNEWLIMEKSYPKQRVKVVLIDEDLGL